MCLSKVVSFELKNKDESLISNHYYTTLENLILGIQSHKHYNTLLTNVAHTLLPKFVLSILFYSSLHLWSWPFRESLTYLGRIADRYTLFQSLTPSLVCTKAVTPFSLSHQPHTIWFVVAPLWSCHHRTILVITFSQRCGCFILRNYSTFFLQYFFQTTI